MRGSLGVRAHDCAAGWDTVPGHLRRSSRCTIEARAPDLRGAIEDSSLASISSATGKRCGPRATLRFLHLDRQTRRRTGGLSQRTRSSVHRLDPRDGAPTGPTTDTPSTTLANRTMIEAFTARAVVRGAPEPSPQTACRLPKHVRYRCATPRRGSCVTTVRRAPR